MPRSFTPSSRTAFMNCCPDRFFWAIHFVFVFPYVFVSVPCAKLSWPSRRLLNACEYTVSYRIVTMANHILASSLLDPVPDSGGKSHCSLYAGSPMKVLWILHTSLVWSLDASTCVRQDDQWRTGGFCFNVRMPLLTVFSSVVCVSVRWSRADGGQTQMGPRNHD